MQSVTVDEADRLIHGIFYSYIHRISVYIHLNLNITLSIFTIQAEDFTISFIVMSQIHNILKNSSEKCLTFIVSRCIIMHII